GDMTQTLNFTDTPLVMALLQKSLGADLRSQWFPGIPPNPQSPNDPGPYPPGSSPAPIAAFSQITDSEAVAAADAYQRLAALPAGLGAPRGGHKHRGGAAAP